MDTINGVGQYIRGLSERTHGTPKQAAKKAKDHGLSFVAIMSVWQDYQKGKFRHLKGNLRGDKLTRYAEAFKAQGIDVGLWFYPWGGHEERLLSDLHAVCGAAPIDFILDDGELGHKWKTSRRRHKNDTGTMRGGQSEAFSGGKATGTKFQRVKQVTDLWDGLADIVSQGASPLLGATAYGVAGYHPTFPWTTKLERADFLSPQLYTASAKQVDLGINQWRRRALIAPWSDADIPVIPSIATFGKKSGRAMNEHLESFVDGEEDIDGFISWSWRQTSRQEWRDLAKWAERIDRGIMRLGGR